MRQIIFLTIFLGLSAMDAFAQIIDTAKRDPLTLEVNKEWNHYTVDASRLRSNWRKGQTRNLVVWVENLSESGQNRFLNITRDLKVFKSFNMELSFYFDGKIVKKDIFFVPPPYGEEYIKIVIEVYRSDRGEVKYTGYYRYVTAVDSRAFPEARKIHDSKPIRR